MATFAVPPPQTRDWRELPDAKTIDTGSGARHFLTTTRAHAHRRGERRAVLAAPMRAAIARLARHAPVAVVSGRAREKVREFVAVENLYYAGNTASTSMDRRAPKQVGAAVPISGGGSQLGRLRYIGCAPGRATSFPCRSTGARRRADRPRVAGAVDAVLALAPFRTTLRKFSGKAELRPSAAWNKARRPYCSTWCARPRAARTTGSTA